MFCHIRVLRITGEESPGFEHEPYNLLHKNKQPMDFTHRLGVTLKSEEILTGNALAKRADENQKVRKSNGAVAIHIDAGIVAREFADVVVASIGHIDMALRVHHQTGNNAWFPVGYCVFRSNI